MSVVYPPTQQRRNRSLRVICVKWGDKYDDTYVEHLRDMCFRHLPQHEFVCITDKPVEGVQCNPLVCDLPGWWQKVGLFQPGLFPGQNLYLDLDVVLTGSISPFLAAALVDPLKLWTLDDFGYPLRNPRKDMGEPTRKLLGGPGTVNSSVMLWHGWHDSVVYDIWNKWHPATMDELHGDQNWITQALYPGGIRFLPDGYAKSYKYSNRAIAPLVVFHGEPKPHQVEDDWVKENWK